MLGTYVLSAGYYDAYYLKAQQVRTLIRRDYEQAFARVDVVAMPTSPTPAFRLGEKTDDPLQMYLADVFTVSANLSGLPAISVPCGFSGGRLPIGLQLTGRAFDEATLLRIAGAYERRTEWTNGSGARQAVAAGLKLRNTAQSRNATTSSGRSGVTTATSAAMAATTATSRPPTSRIGSRTTPTAIFSTVRAIQNGTKSRPKTRRTGRSTVQNATRSTNAPTDTTAATTSAIMTRASIASTAEASAPSPGTRDLASTHDDRGERPDGMYSLLREPD